MSAKPTLLLSVHNLKYVHRDLLTSYVCHFKALQLWMKIRISSGRAESLQQKSAVTQLLWAADAQMVTKAQCIIYGIGKKDVTEWIILDANKLKRWAPKAICHFILLCFSFFKKGFFNRIAFNRGCIFTFMETFVATQLKMLMYIERMSINLFSSFYTFAFTRKDNSKSVFKCLLSFVRTPNYLLSLSIIFS